MKKTPLRKIIVSAGKIVLCLSAVYVIAFFGCHRHQKALYWVRTQTHFLNGRLFTRDEMISRRGILEGDPDYYCKSAERKIKNG